MCFVPAVYVDLDHMLPKWELMMLQLTSPMGLEFQMCRIRVVCLDLDRLLRRLYLMMFWLYCTRAVCLNLQYSELVMLQVMMVWLTRPKVWMC